MSTQVRKGKADESESKKGIRLTYSHISISADNHLAPHLSTMYTTLRRVLPSLSQLYSLYTAALKLNQLR